MIKQVFRISDLVNLHTPAFQSSNAKTKVNVQNDVNQVTTNLAKGSVENGFINVRTN